MSYRFQFQLPEGVYPEDPEAAELLAKFKALQPLPKPTAREQLAETLYGAYHASAVNPHDITLAGADSETQSDVLSQADAAIVFFRQVLRDAEAELGIEEPQSSFDRTRNNGMSELVNNVLERLHK